MHRERMSESRAEAWPELAGLIRSSPVHNQVRPPRSDSRTADNLSLTDSSYLGALALTTSGVLVDGDGSASSAEARGTNFPGLTE